MPTSDQHRCASAYRSICTAPPFQRAVWQALLGIHSGSLSSYGAIAAAIGAPTAVRAVGAAIGRNPVSIIVPCHRVIGSSGALTGYAGGIDRKRALLQLEACRRHRPRRPCWHSMKQRDLIELVALAALWGASFLFTRISAEPFGAVALSGLRVAGAALALLPILLFRRELPDLRANWRPIMLLGITNSALPFLGFSYAVLTISGGLSSIFNAAAPLFGALIAWLWLGERLGAARVLGLGIGFAGVFGLVWSKSDVSSDGSGVQTLLAVLACIASSLAYGFSANFTRRYLADVAPMAVATGSQLSAAIVLALPTWWLWPQTTPGAGAWASLAALAVFCTGFAYVLYFRLIAHLGASTAITVTFLIPAFAIGVGSAVPRARRSPRRC